MSDNLDRILIVDDEEGMRLFLKDALLKEGYAVMTASTGPEAIDIVKSEKKPFKVVIMDMKMPGGLTGVETILAIKGIYNNIVPIILTAYGEEKMGIDALTNGKGAFLTKPVEISTIREVVKNSLKQYDESTAEDIYGSSDGHIFYDIIGESPKILEVRELIKDISDADVTVLVLGESGTGKELVARAIHHASDRKEGPFVGLNCSAIPDTLLESELFGHEKGAFTGAEKEKLGKFEIANKGTIFLDEVADMNLITQAKLLRVLQEREIERVGSSKPIKIDVRVIAATNKNLEEEVASKRFREDLFYRLNVVPIHLPPLRHRKEDIPVLIKFFIETFGDRLGKEASHVSIEAMEAIMAYDWPGNVRELENAVQRALVLSKDKAISLTSLPPKMQKGSKMQEHDIQDEHFNNSVSLGDISRKVMGETEKDVIIKALEKAGGNRQKAASLLKISRMTLYNKLKKYGIVD